MIREEAPGARIIHLGGDPPDEIIPTFIGYSQGRWEGETLVVITTHIRDDTRYRTNYGRPVLVGENTRITERFTRVSENELNYQYTVEDSRFYNQPLAW